MKLNIFILFDKLSKIFFFIQANLVADVIFLQ